MNHNKTNKKQLLKQIIWFVGITLPLTYLIGLTIWNRGGLASPWSVVTMYVPALTVMGLYLFKFRIPIFKGGDLGIRFKGWKYWIIAPLTITILSLISYGISYLINPEMFEDSNKVLESLGKKGFDQLGLIGGMLSVILLNGFIGSLANIPMFLGEEIGWRGFLVPRLLKLTSPLYAFLTGAFVWALWHAIMIAQGLNYPDIHPVIGVMLMVGFCFPVGIIFQYFYHKSKSIFVAALSHAAMNKSAMSMSFLLKEDSYNTLIYGPTGLIGIIIFSLTAIYLYKKVDWEIYK